MSVDKASFAAVWNLKECRKQSARKVPAPHQRDALVKLNRWYEKVTGDGKVGGILVLPTGGGKTFTAVNFLCNGPLSDGYKVLWLAHTHHLLEQAFHTFKPDMLGQIREPRKDLRIKVVSGTPGHHPPRDIRTDDDVVIATLQTITNANNSKLAAFKQFLDATGGKLFIVFDEAHHAPAPSYAKLLESLQERGAPVLGLTATPTYTDETKKGWLKKLFPQGLLAQARASDLIAQGILAKPISEQAETCYSPDFDDADYQKWMGTSADLPEDVVDQLAGSAERNAMIAERYFQNKARYGKTIIFTDRWYQCEAIVESLQRRGVRAGAVYSHVDAAIASQEDRRKRDRSENAKVLEQFRQNELDVIINVRMLTEGTDLPDAQTVFLTRQTTSQILLTQMVGRALRGPKFGGTPEAYIVAFIDDWQQAIRWAEYDPLAEGRADDDPRASPKRPPLHLISIDLVKRLARQMATGVNVTPGPFTSLMPVGWFRVCFDAAIPGTDDIEPKEQLVMVFENEKKAFDRLIAELKGKVPAAFASESVDYQKEGQTVDSWRQQFLGESKRSQLDVAMDVFHIARHLGQGRGTPQFFPFEVRGDHDLDVVVREHIRRKTDLVQSIALLKAEYERKDRFWRTLFPRFELMQSYYYACLMRGFEDDAPVPEVKPDPVDGPSGGEVDDAIREQVKQRDGHQCLACGATKYLQVDHIVPVYHGGTNDIDNLQTLCKVCNGRKGKRTVRFTNQRTPHRKAPKAFEELVSPNSVEPGDRSAWERWLRRSLNFYYECSAVAKVEIAGRGAGYYNWNVELYRDNPAEWLSDHLDAIAERISESRQRGGKPPIKLCISAPGQDVWESTTIEAD